MISKIQQLIFALQYNLYRRDIAPASARILLPAGTTNLTPCLDTDGSTNLFVAAWEGIFVFAADNQGDLANPALIINYDSDTEVLGSVRKLSTFSMGGRTICTLNGQSGLVVTSCDTGSETSTRPSPGQTWCCLHRFSGQEIVQLTEDADTSCWTPRRIALPPLSVDNVHGFHSFTTHIDIIDEDGDAKPETIISIKDVTAGVVYINSK
ncbi:hypothetical protein OQA88_11589 [Cercophora sp. LCS_1]